MADKFHENGKYENGKHENQGEKTVRNETVRNVFFWPYQKTAKEMAMGDDK